MRIDDIAADLVARNSTYVAALSTTGVPLVTLTANMIFTRDYLEPFGKVTVFIEAQPETFEEIGPTFSIASMSVTFTVFCMGATESVLREQAQNYAKAINNCMKDNPYYFGLTARDDFDGVEGKQDIKATKITLDFKYEE